MSGEKKKKSKEKRIPDIVPSVALKIETHRKHCTDHILITLYFTSPESTFVVVTTWHGLQSQYCGLQHNEQGITQPELQIR